MKLYEIKQEIENCITLDDGTTVGGVTGEILDKDKLDALEMEKSEKIKNIALWIKNLKADIAGYDTELDSLRQRKERDNKKIESLTKYLQYILAGEKVKDAQYEITYRKSKAVNITNEKAIDDRYLIPQPPKIDKRQIMADLKANVPVMGAELIERQNMIIK